MIPCVVTFANGLGYVFWEYNLPLDSHLYLALDVSPLDHFPLRLLHSSLERSSADPLGFQNIIRVGSRVPSSIHSYLDYGFCTTQG